MEVVTSFKQYRHTGMDVMSQRSCNLVIVTVHETKDTAHWLTLLGLGSGNCALDASNTVQTTSRTAAKPARSVHDFVAHSRHKVNSVVQQNRTRKVHLRFVVML